MLQPISPYISHRYVVGARVVQRMLRHFGSTAPMVALLQQGLPHEVQLHANP